MDLRNLFFYSNGCIIRLGCQKNKGVLRNKRFLCANLPNRSGLLWKENRHYIKSHYMFFRRFSLLKLNFIFLHSWDIDKTFSLLRIGKKAYWGFMKCTSSPKCFVVGSRAMLPRKWKGPIWMRWNIVAWA